MNRAFDTLVRGGRLVTPEGVVREDLAISGGRIVACGPHLAGEASRLVDAGGSYVFPGFIDAHVHFNEPGRTDWEGLATGSAALAAGGGTCFFDMPLNSEPPVLDAARFREKVVLAREKSHTEFALWGGLTPANLDRLAELRDAGAIGLKAFMSESGISSFQRVDEPALRAGMTAAAQLGLIVAVHAEDNGLAVRHTAEKKSASRDVRAYLASRPVEVELAAIRDALALAHETGCALHIVHVSSPEGLELIAEAKTCGTNVTAETCPHYLLLNEDDVVRLGAPAKCAPPIRDEQRRRALWSALRAGFVDTIGSDHSPAPGAMKTGEDFFAIWGGIGGVQHGFELLLSETLDSAERDWPLLSAVLSRNVARRFRLGPHKGGLAVGCDADLAVVTPAGPREIVAAELLTRHPISAYVGRVSRVRITHTFVRGLAVWADGRLTGEAPAAQLLLPQPAPL